MAKNIEKVIKDTASTLLKLIGINGKVAVSEDKEGGLWSVEISTEDTGILIGRHGDTISALQLILCQVVQKKTGEWYRILVDTGDYRAKQEEMLTGLARSAAERVKQTGAPYSMYDLSPAQRRFVHTVLSDDPQVLTESEGEGRDRHLVVKPRG